MNKFLLTAFAVGAALAAGPALAADMGTPAYKAPPPPPPPAMSWTGFYVGTGFSYDMVKTDTQLQFLGAPVASSGSTGLNGWAGLVNAGYDYQFALYNMNLVAGVFGDYNFSSVKGTFDTGFIFGGTEKESSYWSVGGRIGWLVTPQVLSYWNVGYTEARFDQINLASLTVPIPVGFNISGNTYHGWFLGGGMEAQVTLLPIKGLFFNTEYRYSNYNSATLPVNGSAAIAGSTVFTNIHPIEQSVTTGLKYKFNWN